MWAHCKDTMALASQKFSGVLRLCNCGVSYEHNTMPHVIVKGYRQHSALTCWPQLLAARTHTVCALATTLSPAQHRNSASS